MFFSTRLNIHRYLCPSVINVLKNSCPWAVSIHEYSCRSALNIYIYIHIYPSIWLNYSNISFLDRDMAPHPKNKSSMSEEILLTLLRNTTALIKETFPGVPVYVALGNHDFYPSSQLPGHTCKLYNETARVIWRDWLQTDINIETFAKGRILFTW